MDQSILTYTNLIILSTWRMLCVEILLDCAIREATFSEKLFSLIDCLITSKREGVVSRGSCVDDDPETEITDLPAEEGESVSPQGNSEAG